MVGTQEDGHRQQVHLALQWLLLPLALKMTQMNTAPCSHSSSLYALVLSAFHCSMPNTISIATHKN